MLQLAQHNLFFQSLTNKKTTPSVTTLTRRHSPADLHAVIPARRCMKAPPKFLLLRYTSRGGSVKKFN
jgi:hypothetical protein